MNNNQKEINEKELEKANGGQKIVVDYSNNKFLETLKSIAQKLKEKLNRK